MPRFAFLIEYDGTPFSGWQRQPNVASVQGAFEAAIRVLEPGHGGIAAAGRTDAGVHATGQVAQADMTRDWDPFRLSEALNQHLKPAPIVVLACARVADDWHARFSAIERRYTYRVLARRARPTLGVGKTWGVRHPVDVNAMREGAAHLIGLHDFTTYRSTMCQAKSPVKTLDSLEIEEVPVPGGHEVLFHLKARSFLHNQVRSIVGTLMRVGAGAWEPARVGAVLAARKRAACGPVAPPDGLYLTQVIYPQDPFA